MTNHGGRRKGAGRPALNVKRVNITIDPETDEILSTIASSRSEAIRVMANFTSMSPAAEEARTALFRALNDGSSPARIDELKANYARLTRAYWNAQSGGS